jgi:hypothetical protein
MERDLASIYPSLEQIKMTVFSLPLSQQEWLLGELDQHIKQMLIQDLDNMVEDTQLQGELSKMKYPNAASCGVSRGKITEVVERKLYQYSHHYSIVMLVFMVLLGSG